MLVSRAKFEGFLTGYGLVLGLVLATTALVLVHGGSVLNYAFPAAATIVAGILMSARRSVYVAFVWWIWLFTPLVRRLADYQSGYHNISPIMLSPLLVTSFALYAVAVRPGALLQRGMGPFLSVILALLLTLVVGMATNGVLPALFDFANWILPLAFAIFLMIFPSEFEEMKSSFLSAVMLGLLIISAYGIYQFFHVPPWDAYWLNSSHFDSAGAAVDSQLRLFGTLNSPGPYATVLLVSLLFVVVAKGPVRLGAAVFGFPAFGLSLVRSAWGAFFLAVLFLAWRVGGKTRVRIFVVGSAIAVAIVPLVTVGPVADTLSARFSTLNNLQNDESYQARQSLYENTTIIAFEQPIGAGFGKFGVSAKLTTGQSADFDSGALTVPYIFGWVGGSLFIWALGIMVFRVLSGTGETNDRVAIAAGGVFLSLLVLNLFGTTFAGVSGIALWSGAALVLAPRMARAISADVQPKDAHLNLAL